MGAFREWVHGWWNQELFFSYLHRQWQVKSFIFTKISGSFEPLDVLNPLERLGRGYKELGILAEFSAKGIPLFPFAENSPENCLFWFENYQQVVKQNLYDMGNLAFAS